MKNTPTKKIYWGIGLENETYLQFADPLIVSGAFIQEKIGIGEQLLILVILFLMAFLSLTCREISCVS